MATRLGYPAVTPLRDRSEVALRVEAIRQRLNALDTEVTRLGSVADSSSVAVQVTNLTRALTLLQQRVSALESQIGVTDTVTLAASDSVARFDVIVPSTPNHCATADPNDRTKVHGALGVALNAGSAGSPITIQRRGPLTLTGVTLDPGRAVYAGVLGQMTQDPSLNAIIIPVGVATSTSTIWVSPALAILNELDVYSDAFDQSMPVTLALLQAQVETLQALLTLDDGFVFLYQGSLITRTDGGGGGGAVSSVNGQIGDVELALGDLVDVSVAGAEPRQVLSLESSTWVPRTLSGLAFTFATLAPDSPTEGDRWYNPDDGIMYTYLVDGSNAQWVEL